MLAALEAWLAQGGTLVPLWRAILWLSAAYLALLGASALIVPRLAGRFLSGFAANQRVNLIEAALRTIVGLALIGAAATTAMPDLARPVGAFLIVTAGAIAAFPAAHHRFAKQVIGPVLTRLALFGLLALALGLALAWFIA